MFFSSRMSRQPTPEANTAPHPSAANDSPVSADSGVEQRTGDVSEQPSSSHTPRRMSKDSEGYPSWLPKRPPPPAPASTFHSSVGMHDSPVDPVPQFVVGRKPTPRSVRIVSLQEDFIGGAPAADVDVDHGNGHPHAPRPNARTSARAWSRASGAAVFSNTDPYASRIPQPKFHSRGLHLELLRNPSKLSRLYFYLWPIILFYHIPLQTFFDFNAVFILIQVSKFPNPQAPGVPGSGKNWALGAAAYVACWLVWILVVFIVYELIYSFVRRWRVKRPLMLPIYLSSPAFNYVALTSYVNFCFLQHIRYSSFFGEHGSIRDGLSETFYYFSQNLPTVALLLPRAGLSFALLLSFSSPSAAELASIGSGQSAGLGRDMTFFRNDGSLSGYARGVLIANCAWTAWRILVLLISWISLWVLSGQGCAGLCGPRYRWEEEDQEKRYSVYSDAASDQIDALPWSWRECTRLRVQDAYEFCLTIRPSLRWSHARPKEGISPTPDEMQQVLAAVLPSVPQPARRGVLSDDLFEPKEEKRSPRFSDIIPKAFVSGRDTEAVEGPLRELPYPFTKPGTGRVGSQDQVLFPPSHEGSPEQGTSSGSTGSGSGSGSSSSRSSGTEEEEEGEEDDEEEEEDDDDDDDAASPTSDERASGSLSSLGQPVASRYPFQFRRPAGGNGQGHGRGGSGSSGAATSHGTRSMLSGSAMSHSTGNRPSSDTNSQQSPTSRPRASLSQSSMSVAGIPGIPMPPRHPQQPRRRAGTVPTHASGSSAGSAAAISAAVEFPSVRRRIRADSGPGIPVAYQPGGAQFYDTSDDEEEADQQERVYADDDAEPEGSEEAGEREDRVGLLELVGSRTSLHNRGSRSRLSLPSSSSGSGSSSSRSRSNSRSRADSNRSSARSRANSVSISMRSRAQSLIQSVGAVSQTSLDMVRGTVGVRSRANSSMARLEEDVPYSSSSFEGRRVGGVEAGYYSSSGGTHSRSGSASANENYTFGQPMAFLGHLRQTSEGSRARSPSHLREEVEHGTEIEEVPREADEDREEHAVPQQQRQSPEQPVQDSQLLRPQDFDAQFSLSGQMSSSSLSVESRSVQPSERTASPVEPPTPVPGSAQYSPEHTGRAIPIPISSWPGAAHGESASNASTSPGMISTAAGSFVTAPATLEGTTTESSGQRTLGRNSSWGEMAAGVGGPVVGGQMVMPGGGEREDPSGGAWRIP